MRVGFRDRAAAGRALGERLADTGAADAAAADQVIVLGLPRGGVPVAAAVARVLGVPWDVLLVRKLGVPGHPELAFGAVASGGVEIRNDDVVRHAGLDPATMQAVADTERAELARRETALRAGRPPPQLAGRRVVLVDDGVATGASMAAAVAAVRAQGAAAVIVAAPVAPAAVLDRMAAIADDVVICLAPAGFHAVGAYYQDFEQLTDAEVRAQLA